MGTMEAAGHRGKPTTGGPKALETGKRAQSKLSVPPRKVILGLLRLVRSVGIEVGRVHRAPHLIATILSIWKSAKEQGRWSSSSAPSTGGEGGGYGGDDGGLEGALFEGVEGEALEPALLPNVLHAAPPHAQPLVRRLPVQHSPVPLGLL